VEGKQTDRGRAERGQQLEQREQTKDDGGEDDGNWPIHGVGTSIRALVNRAAIFGDGKDFLGQWTRKAAGASY
jgi:hypothetical protein